MEFKDYFMFGVFSIVGSTLGWLISEENSVKKIAAKGLAGLMIGMAIVPAFMPYFKLPMEVWYGVIAVSSVVGVDIIILLTKKMKEYLQNKIKTN
jgi:hypothetical protein